MQNEKSNKRYLYGTVAMTVCGLFLASRALLLFYHESNRVAFQILGASFICFSFAATPAALFERLGRKRMIPFNNMSKVFAVLAALMLLISILLYFSKGS